MSLSLAIISLINSNYILNLHFLYLVGSAASFAGCVAISGVGWRAGILSTFLIGNNLLLKILKTFSLALKNNLKLFKKDLLSSVFMPLSKFFNSLSKLLYLLSASFFDKFPLCISLK